MGPVGPSLNPGAPAGECWSRARQTADGINRALPFLAA